MNSTLKDKIATLTSQLTQLTVDANVNREILDLFDEIIIHSSWLTLSNETDNIRFWFMVSQSDNTVGLMSLFCKIRSLAFDHKKINPLVTEIPDKIHLLVIIANIQKHIQLMENKITELVNLSAEELSLQSKNLHCEISNLLAAIYIKIEISLLINPFRMTDEIDRNKLFLGFCYEMINLLDKYQKFNSQMFTHAKVDEGLPNEHAANMAISATYLCYFNALILKNN